MPSYEEICQKVVATLVEALNVDPEEATPLATLQGDLGAESIDFLDIVFRLEREFKIKIPRNELFPESIFQGDPEFVQNGRATLRGMEELRQKMPFADLSKFEKNPELSAISDLFTVEMICKYIEGKLQGSARYQSPWQAPLPPLVPPPSQKPAAKVQKVAKRAMAKAEPPKSIDERVTEVLVRELVLDDQTARKINLKTTVAGDLGLRLIDCVAVAACLNQEFGLSLPTRELFPAHWLHRITVGMIAEAIEAKLKD